MGSSWTGTGMRVISPGSTWERHSSSQMVLVLCPPFWGWEGNSSELKHQVCPNSPEWRSLSLSELWVSCWTIYRMVLQLGGSSSSSSLNCEQLEDWQCGLLISRCSELIPGKLKVKMIFSQSCLTLWDAMECSPPGSSVHEIFLGKYTGVICHFLLQGIFLTEGSNPGLLHCR